MPTNTFNYNIVATQTAANTYTLGDSIGATAFQDQLDSQADDLTQLGDIANDHYTTTINVPSFGPVTAQLQYIGETAQGFLGVVTNFPLPAYVGRFIFSTNQPSYANGQSITVAPGAYAICFRTGTLIRTIRGEVAVEDLRVGDRAVTASGETRAIRWLGHREVRCAGHARPSEVHPVRILAGAFGGGLPERDLFLSPGHPVLVGQGGGEVLVPIMCLVNGTSIARVPVEAVTYWHVELEEHDILLAEGLPAESFLDFGNRPWFENGADHALTNPDFIPPGLSGRCRPVATDGPVVERERRRLDALFATSLSAQCAWPSREDDWAAA